MKDPVYGPPGKSEAGFTPMSGKTLTPSIFMASDAGSTSGIAAVTLVMSPSDSLMTTDGSGLVTSRYGVFEQYATASFWPSSTRTRRSGIGEKTVWTRASDRDCSGRLRDL